MRTVINGQRKSVNELLSVHDTLVHLDCFMKTLLRPFSFHPPIVNHKQKQKRATDRRVEYYIAHNVSTHSHSGERSESQR